MKVEICSFSNRKIYPYVFHLSRNANLAGVAASCSSVVTARFVLTGCERCMCGKCRVWFHSIGMSGDGNNGIGMQRTTRSSTVLCIVNKRGWSGCTKTVLLGGLWRCLGLILDPSIKLNPTSPRPSSVMVHSNSKRVLHNGICDHTSLLIPFQCLPALFFSPVCARSTV